MFRLPSTIDNALFFGAHDFRQRYQGSRLGIWWGPLTAAIFIGFLSVIWSTLFKVALGDYLVFFAIGHLVWAYFSGCLGEASSGLQQFESIVKNVRVGVWFFVVRIVYRNSLALGINSIVLLVVLVAFPESWNLSSIWMLGFGLLILVVVTASLTALALLMCTAFRDATPIVGSALTMLMFGTPIMWLPALILSSPFAWVVEINPFFHVIEAVRSPIMGTSMTASHWAVAASFAACVALLAYLSVHRYDRRVAYWL